MTDPIFDLEPKEAAGLQERIFYKKVGKYFGLFLVIFLMIFFVFYLGRSARMLWLMYPIGTIALVFFGLAGLVFFIQYLRSPIGLLLNVQGFIDRSSAVSKGKLVPWQAVSDVKLVNYMGQNFITVYLKDEEAYLASLPFLKRMTARSVQSPNAFWSNQYRSRCSERHPALPTGRPDEGLSQKISLKSWFPTTNA